MDNITKVLNERLAQASKKFSKACDQIKLLKQRIAELIKIFSYCDQSNNHQQIFASESSPTPTVSTATSTPVTDDNQTYLNLISKNDQLILNEKNANINLFKETIRHQIENLQSIKTAYFMYAHKKADEITKLQCELYGEDAVREAYEMASPEALLPASASNHESENEDSNDIETETELETENEFDLNQSNNVEQTENFNASLHQSDSSQVDQENYWTPWDVTQQDHQESSFNFSTSANSSMHNHSSLMNENDYLIA